MNAKRAILLSFFFALILPSRQQCPLACNAVSAGTGGWVSDVSASRAPRDPETGTATQFISWDIDPTRPPGQQYVVYYRIRDSGLSWQSSDATNMSSRFEITMLPYDNRYEVIVCYDNVTADRQPQPGATTSIGLECGQCMDCFRTSPPPVLNVIRAMLVDNQETNELTYEIEVFSDPGNVTFNWMATDINSPSNRNVSISNSDNGVEITTTNEGSNIVSRLTLTKMGRFRMPNVSVTNGFNQELTSSDAFTRIVPPQIVRATIEDNPGAVVYSCMVSGEPLNGIDIMWDAIRQMNNPRVILNSATPGVIGIELEQPSMGTVTGELELSRNTPYSMVRCVARLDELTSSQSDFTPATSTELMDLTSDPGLPEVLASPSTIPLEIVIPLLVAPIIVTPICVLCGILLYRRCRIISKKKKNHTAVRMNALHQYTPHQPSTANGNTDAVEFERSTKTTADLELSTRSAIDEDVERPIAMLREKLPDDMIIDPTELKVSVVIGQGEFGVIYKANYYSQDGVTVVAVKTLKGIFTTASDIENATKEILKMYRFNHLNVMSLIGVCMSPSSQGSSSGPSMVMPFMAKGSLLDYLRKEASNLKATRESEVSRVRKPLVQICQQIAKGMEYLSGMKFIHRDLAARNCLMDSAGVIKVSDFGLTENLYSRNYFREVRDGAKLPIKWMALESIKLGVFTEKTDVWAYGVTCWEVFSGGSIPYPGLHPREVLDILENGERLHKPKNLACCSSMYKLLCSCWYEQYEERPTFSALVQGLEHYLEVTSDYLDLAAVSVGTIDTDDDHASRLSSEAEEIASLPDSGSNKNSLNRHSILDRVISSPNEYAEAGSF